MPKSVLVVDGNDLNRRLWVDVLEANGYRTLSAGAGDEVVPLVRRQRPDLILMEIGLPPVSGLDAVRKLKAEPGLRDIAVLAVTALAMPGDEERLRGAGCDGYLAKPVRLARFLEAVRTFAGRGD